MKVKSLAVLIAAPVALGVALAVGVSAFAASPQPRDSVPDSQLKSFRTLSQQFKDAGADPRYVAITDLAGISCIADPAGSGAMGIHYLDKGNLLDGGLDPNNPEAIVYAPGPNGSLRVAALEYIVFKDAWDTTHNKAPEFIAGHPFMTTDAPNRFGLPAYYSQHIWVGLGNPLGNLHLWNPSVHCP